MNQLANEKRIENQKESLDKQISIEDFPWWKRTTVYQIYPRSFMDTTGNGIGDLRGIINKLDYVKSLGVETIWFSPFYKSPFADMGYDIAGYREICEEMGDMATVDELIEEIHVRDMKIVMDMVLNHTSDQHPWFLESKSSKDNPKSDWYVWRDGKKPTKKMPGGSRPPNNWRSMIMGSGWHYYKEREQWNWAQFLSFQPDLNYRNPEVQEEMLDTVRFWLKKKIDGFRLDIINALFEDNQFRDNPFSFSLLPSDKSEANLFRNPINTLNHPDTLKFMRKLRSTIDEFSNPERFMVGEVSASLPVLRQYLGDNADGLNLVFLFQSLGIPLRANKIRALIKDYESYFKDPYMPTWVFGNHDRFRRISRLGGKGLENIRRGKINAALQLTARGVPFIYYGEEIGMENHHIPKKVSQDAVTHHFDWIPQWVLDLVWKYAHESLNRDDCRTPMQWTPEENGGFSAKGVKTWLPLTPSYKERNVSAEDSDPDSILNCYRRFLSLRREYAALQVGQLELLTIPQSPKSLLAYSRRLVTKEINQKLYVYLNFSGSSIKAPFILPVSEINERNKNATELRILGSTYANSLKSAALVRSEGGVRSLFEMKPWEGFVFDLK